MGNNRFVLKCQDGTFLDNPQIDGLKVDFFGIDNSIIIEEGGVFHNVHIKMRNNAEVIIDKTMPRGIRNTVIDMVGSPNSSLVIKKNCSIESCRFAMANEMNLSITIGEDCMLSSNIVFRATDGHAIFELNDNKLINHSKPIIIGNHVWLGADVVIMKGTKILNNSVIGTKSLVTKSFTEGNVVIAGNPAAIVKRYVNWDRKYIDNY